MSTYPPENDSPNATPIYNRSASADALDGEALVGDSSESYPGVHVPAYGTDTTGTADAEFVSPLPPIPAGAGADGSTGGTSSGKADAAKGAAKDVAGDAKQAGAHVTGVAKEQAGKVASEATDHARQLYGQASASVKSQAGQQQERAASGLRTIGQQLSSMADNAEDNGIATKVVRDLSSRAHTVAGYLEDRDAGSLLSEIRSYAARKPGTFIALAAGAGILAGRLTKALTAEIKHEHEREDGFGGTGSAL